MIRLALGWTGRAQKDEININRLAKGKGYDFEDDRARLPGEIWDMIWALVIDSTPPRLVEIKHKEDGTAVIFTSPSPIPPVLQVCTRSRALAMRRWKLCLGTKGECPKIFFDCETDLLYFGKSFRSIKLFKEQVNEEDRQRVRSTGFATRATVDGTSGRSLYLDMLASRDQITSPSALQEILKKIRSS